MFSTNVTIYHRLISQAGWNRCNLSIYLSIYLSSYTELMQVVPGRPLGDPIELNQTIKSAAIEYLIER